MTHTEPLFSVAFFSFTSFEPQNQNAGRSKSIPMAPTGDITFLEASVGYGASMNGISALLTMINSCANGIAVVNIDNGYGAGYLATQINRLAVHGSEEEKAQ